MGLLDGVKDSKILRKKARVRYEREQSQDQDDTTQPPRDPPTTQGTFSIDDILNGQAFYDSDLPTALQQALDYATPKGIVATMPELIAAKTQADEFHKLWQQGYDTLTEEIVCIDYEGKFVDPGQAVLIVLHGGGMLPPDRIQRTYKEGLKGGAAKFTNEEVLNLLQGKLPNGEECILYSYDNFPKQSNLPRAYGIVLPFETAKATESGWHEKKEFLENPLVIARAGGKQYLEAYFDKAKRFDGKVGNWHRFEKIDFQVPQGRLLYLGYDRNGLNGNLNLNDLGRFLGVAPEAHSK